MQTRDMTKGSIRTHLLKMTIPASIGMMFNTLFNVVDTIYAGKIGTLALAGMSLSFPIYFIMLSIVSGIGSGTMALISNAIGAKNKDDFHAYLYNALIIGGLTTLVVIMIGRFVGEPLLIFMGASGDALQAAMDYIQVLFLGTIFFAFNSIFNAALASQGDTKSYRNILILAFLLNLILDPLFIFGWWGLPKMGTAGVALATVIVQGLGAIYMMVKVYQSQLFSWQVFIQEKFQVEKCKDLLRQGVPASLNMMTIALGIFVINYFVVKHAGQVGIAAYGVAIRIEQLALLPALGLNTATLTIVGQNYGGGHYDRITITYKKALSYGVMLLTLGMIVIYPGARLLVSLFNDDPEVIAVGTRYLRIEYLCFNTYIIMNVSIALLQGLKRPKLAIYVGLYRQLVMPLVLFTIMGASFGIVGIWYGIVIINWSAAIYVLIYTIRSLRQVKLELLERE